jgi:hypothetical protein
VVRGDGGEAKSSWQVYSAVQPKGRLRNGLGDLSLRLSQPLHGANVYAKMHPHGAHVSQLRVLQGDD